MNYTAPFSINLLRYHSTINYSQIIDQQNSHYTKTREYIRNIKRLMKEADTGQITNNPYILVRRLLKSNDSVTLIQLNEVLLNSLGFTITQEEFDRLLSLTPTSIPYPLKANDPLTIRTIGRDLNSSHRNSRSNRKGGVYLFTNNTNGYQYVGSSINLAKRVRSYGTPSQLTSRRGIIKAINTEGMNSFGLSVYVINMSLPLFANSNIKNLTLALEQYFIIRLKTVYNNIKVVGKAPMPTGILAGNNIKKPFYVYNEDCTQLLFIAESQKDFVRYTGLSSQAVLNCLNSGKHLFGSFVLSRVKLEGPMEEAIISQEEIINIINNARLLRYAKRKLSSHILLQKQQVKLTDLTGEYPTMTFSSKNELCRYIAANHSDRKVGAWALKGYGPFNMKDWLIEVMK